jgi:hypothetical protein
MKAFIIFSILFLINCVVAIGQSHKVTVVDINPHTMWGIVKFSKNNYKETDLRTLSPALVRFSPAARRTVRKHSRLIWRIERTYHR